MKRILFAVLLALPVALALVFYLGLAEDASGPAPAAPVSSAQQIARGAYLARTGNCMACHTVRGGPSYAGGRSIRTPFGDVYSSNLTPDKQTGIGNWTADDFWRAIHNGKSKDGRLLYPAFPYPNYTKVTRADSDAMHAYLMSLPPVYQVNREPDLRFPYNHRILLVGWRALYFRPGIYQPQAGQSAEWNRGAYLVQGLGHCNACHAPRNAFGATEEKQVLAGAMIPNWYAPSLTSTAETGLGDWEVQHIADLLKTGVSARGVASGPMAEVVRESLQHVSDSDIKAMSVYLKSLPQVATASGAAAPAADDGALKLGAVIYEKHCVECHKADGRGEPSRFPPLAGNRGILLDPAINPIRLVLHGGYPPSTAGNPRPYGMPPYAPLLDDREIAAVVSFVRNSWGNQGSMVSPAQVGAYRSVALE